ESWRGQDFFWLPEPGDPIVTERVAEILSRTGNLRRRQIASRNEIRRRTPGWARELEEAGWEQPVCAELGPADWVTRGGPALPGQGTSCQADGHAPSCEAVWSRTTCPGQPGTAPLKRSAGSSSSRSGSDRWLPRVPSRTSAGVAMTGEFYFVTWPGRYPFAVACAPPGYRCDLLKEAEPARDWVPIRFVLRDGAYADYQANDLGWCLCSERLKEVLASHASPEDVLQWLDATVIGPDGEERSYHILHLPRRPDVLDRTKTVFAPGGLVVKPYLNGTMAARHRVFSYLGGTGRLIVHREVRDAVVAARCTGLDFYQAWVA
ncbi:MAG: hypothetical protein QME94_20060, partial [Anaerolineae bacterium]|nr:hypothetical protein [Anaerolineae bacterium]